MEASFDPYRKWLSVRTSERPPNHYHLLGLDAFEDDAETIAHAADQRIAYVRTLAVNDYAELSQRVLNELATAKVCLLNRDKKSTYDRELLAKQPSPPISRIDTSVAGQIAVPPAVSPRAEPHTARAVAVEIPQFAPAESRSAPRPELRRWPSPDYSPSGR